jgi:hypothetical protein
MGESLIYIGNSNSDGMPTPSRSYLYGEFSNLNPTLEVQLQK